MKKTFVAAALSVMLAFSSAFPAMAAQRVNSAWAESYISSADSMGIIPSGISNIDMTRNITREEFCELVYNTVITVAKQNSIKITYNAREAHFYDTDSKAVMMLYRMEIIAGRTSTRFAPKENITREEAAVVLDKTAEYLGLVRFTNSDRFTDSRHIGEWAYKSVNNVCGMNLMSGMGDGRFNPTGYYTVEQAICSMIRVAGALPKESREKIDSNLYYLYNDSFYWVSDANGKVVFMLPAERYGGVSFYSNGSEILAFASMKGGNSSDIYSISSGRKLFTVNGNVCGTYANKNIIVSAVKNDATYYGVYSFDGKPVLSTEYSWDYLYTKGYVGTPNAW